jgi:hypothetical protein
MDLLEERRADRYRRSRRQSALRRTVERAPRQWRPGGAGALAVVLATGLLVGGVLGWSLARAGHARTLQRASADRPAAAAGRPAAPPGGPACQSVLSRADDSLALAVRFERALADHGRIMERLAQHAITPAQALGMDRQPLAIGSAQAARFDAALADYLAVRDRCSTP